MARRDRRSAVAPRPGAAVADDACFSSRCALAASAECADDAGATAASGLEKGGRVRRGVRRAMSREERYDVERATASPVDQHFCTSRLQEKA